MSERIQLVIDAAERAAAGIREDARAQARRYLEESQARADRMTMERVRLMSELTDALVRQAASVKQRSDRLVAALDDATAKLESGRPADPVLEEVIAAGRTGPAAVAPRLEPAPAAPESTPPSMEEAEDASQPEAEARDDPREARLLAIQMAVAGSSRAEIEAKLRDHLGVTDAGALLDEVVGPERP